MKIVHILQGRCNPDSANGVDKTIYHLSFQQAVMGHDVHIFSITNRPAISIAGVTVVVFRPALIPFCLPDNLLTALAHLAPDIVHFHSIYIPCYVFLARRLKDMGIPYVVTPHGGCSREILKHRWYLKLPWKKCFETPYLNRALFIHSVGDTDQIRAYGVTAPIIVEPNGADQSAIPTEASSNPILTSKPQWAGRSIFLFLGRLAIAQKGLDLMLAGFSKALSTNKLMGLVIVGPDPGSMMKRIKGLLDALSITDDVLITGAAHGRLKYDYLLNADFFVHTSRWEGLPFSIIEALSCGIPCLVTPSANPAGLFSKYAAGLVVRQSEDSIANGFLELARSTKAHRERMRKAAFQLVAEELQWPRIAARLTEGYARLH
jgi:glycosyltransferase involved in cell wall biosynthesis